MNVFLMFALQSRAPFRPPSIVYISAIITHTLQITFLHVLRSSIQIQI